MSPYYYDLRPQKKAEGKRESFPQTPIKRKGKGKETNPDKCCLVAIPARTHTRDPYRRREQDVTLEEALVEFNGSRGKPGEHCDQNMWGNFIAVKGAALFRECVYQARSEIRQKRRPTPDYIKPRILQKILNDFWNHPTNP